MPRTNRTVARLRHNPLHVDIEDDMSPHTLQRRSKRKPEGGVDVASLEEYYLDHRASKQVIELAQLQQHQLAESDVDLSNQEGTLPSAFTLVQKMNPLYDAEDEDKDKEDGLQSNESIPDLDIDAPDLLTFDRLFPSNRWERKTLAEVILSKISSEPSLPALTTRRDSTNPADGLDAHVVQLFTKVGQGMQGTGSLPKVMKVLPSFPDWRRYLALSHPENWHPFACKNATKIFVSSMKPSELEFFFHYVLLPSIRENIGSNKVLNVHYYESLLRGLFKPAAFFKGIVFPLLEESCTLKEAAIIASVMSRRSIPFTHLGAAILRISSLPFSGSQCLFLRVLLDKRKDLPFRVLDGLVCYFMKISDWAKIKHVHLPVLWQQCLLVFVQRHTTDLSPDQRSALLDVVKANFHPQIGPEIRRELAVVCRDR